MRTPTKTIKRARALRREVDGTAHGGVEQASHDERRDAWLAGKGIVVLRFSASDVLGDRTRLDVLETIAAAARERMGPAPSTAFGGPPPPLRG